MIEVSFKNVSRIIQKAFPGAKSRRTVKIEGRNNYHVRDYWDGGSKDEARFLELGTMNTLSSADIPKEVRQVMGNPFNLPICDVKITNGFCVVEHIIFRGKDLGYRIYFSKERFENLNDSNVLEEFHNPSQLESDRPTLPAIELNQTCDTLPCLLASNP